MTMEKAPGTKFASVSARARLRKRKPEREREGSGSECGRLIEGAEFGVVLLVLLVALVVRPVQPTRARVHGARAAGVSCSKVSPFQKRVETETDAAPRFLSWVLVGTVDCALFLSGRLVACFLVASESSQSGSVTCEPTRILE